MEDDGVLVELGGLLSERRLLLCAAGAGLFWLALRRLEARPMRLNTIIGMIVAAGFAILAIRIGLDLELGEPLPLTRAFRWVLGWSTIFGIWLLAAAYRANRVDAATGQSKSGAVAEIPAPYLDLLFGTPRS